ncbi:MAG: hypothetical protein RR847_00260 [Bacilli bacterium]
MMLRGKVTKKLISIIFAGCVLVTSGCSNDTSNVITINSENVDNGNVDRLDVENKIIMFFNEMNNKLNKYVNSDNFNNVKDKVDIILSNIVGFIFYGEAINGVTFESLSQTAKEQIMVIWGKMIMTVKEVNEEYVKDFFINRSNKDVTIRNSAIATKNFVINDAFYVHEKSTDVLTKIKRQVITRISN